MELEKRSFNRMKSQKLKTIKLFKREKFDNDYIEKEFEEKDKSSYKENKVYPKNIKSRGSCPNIFDLCSLNHKKISPSRLNEDKKINLYEVEKGIVKHPLCLLSKNKYFFGSKKLALPKYLKHEHNPNISTKMTTKISDINNKNDFISNLSVKRLGQLNKNNLSKKIKIEIKKNNDTEKSKINLYKRYNNGTGMDKHIIFNRSCPNINSELEYYKNLNKYSKENMIKLFSQENKLNNIFINNNNLKAKQSSFTTIELSKKDKNSNKLFNSTSPIMLRDNINNHFSQKIKNNFSQKMKKYHFVMNTNLIKLDDTKNLPEEIRNFNKVTLNILVKENDKLFSQFRSIVPPNKFSEKYRDPLNNSFDRELAKERKIKEKKIVKMDILPGIKLLKEMDIEINMRKSAKKKVLKGKPLMHKLKKIIIRNVEYIKSLNVSLEEILTKYKISPISFSCFKTEELILAIRNKNYKLCCEILDNYKYIVLDYDYFHLTPLHWAVKVNFFEIIPKLISYGANVNEKDFLGETPLHICAIKNYYESTAILLVYLASPFIKDKSNKMPIDYTKDMQLIFIFKKITEIHLKYIISKQKNFYKNVQKDFSAFISSEFSHQLNPDVLSLISFLK